MELMLFVATICLDATRIVISKWVVVYLSRFKIFISNLFDDFNSPRRVIVRLPACDCVCLDNNINDFESCGIW